MATRFPGVLLALALSTVSVAGAATQTSAGIGTEVQDWVEVGRRIYTEGLLPSGQTITATVAGDVKLSGAQVICVTCHRRSGMGSTEGTEVVPAITGELLYSALRLPTSKPPLAPEIRPAYTDESLKLAIRAGIGATGNALQPLMPRYPLSDAELDALIAYLKTLSTEPSPGVTGDELHFATIVTDSAPPAARKALVDVMSAFFEQKNKETRHETQRAETPPWHKQWVYSPYRKWVLHVWELEGPGATWPAQLEALYREQPVFAVLSGVAGGSWQPIHGFCERERIPCLFPTTDLPVIAEQDFYSLYMSKGITLEAQVVLKHLRDEGLAGGPIVQVYRQDDPRGTAATEVLRRAGLELRDVPVGVAGPDAALWHDLLAQSPEAVLVLWLGQADLRALWSQLASGRGPARAYLSTTLYAGDVAAVPESARQRVFFVHPYELPSKLPRLLARSSGWFKAKRIYAPDALQIQANAYFALKVAGGAAIGIRGYFFRDYFIERIEHMVDIVPYSSVYPHVSLAPGQRFVAKGAYVAQVAGGEPAGLVPVTGWLTP